MLVETAVPFSKALAEIRQRPCQNDLELGNSANDFPPLDGTLPIEGPRSIGGVFGFSRPPAAPPSTYCATCGRDRSRCLARDQVVREG